MTVYGQDQDMTPGHSTWKVRWHSDIITVNILVVGYVHQSVHIHARSTHIRGKAMVGNWPKVRKSSKYGPREEEW